MRRNYRRRLLRRLWHRARAARFRAIDGHRGRQEHGRQPSDRPFGGHRTDRFVEIVNMVGTDRVLFGSDWPHPEGLKDPITFVDDLSDFGEEDIAKIMGGNLMKLMKVSNPVSA